MDRGDVPDSFHISDSESYDSVIIGGGAAGFFAAITAAEISNGSLRILILEKGPEVLQKVKISGGGRCNVTHDLHDPREFTKNYPRGEKPLISPLFRWDASDMIDWLSHRGVELKTEADGRMFPTTDRSQTIIDCFRRETEKHGIEIRCRAEVADVVYDEGAFQISLASGDKLRAEKLLVATGGIRNPTGANLAKKFGHTIEPAAPSLFTFKISDPILEGLSGVSVALGTVRIPELNLENSGPILITHWGLSGPGILKLSALAARQLQQRNYHFNVEISWTAEPGISEELGNFRDRIGAQAVGGRGHFGVPGRLWKRLCEASEISTETKWSQLSKPQMMELASNITECRFTVSGKSMNKDEFVTCGGVSLKEVDFKTMESRSQPRLYFAGEVLDIDGVTGGFNFQSAWTTGRIAGEAIAGL